jgi:phosphoribosylaminoimidazole (AIR) synthetase
MYKTFNNGIGYVIVVDPRVADEALGILGRFHNADIIGEVTAGKGRVAIESRYDYTTVVYE